MTRRHYEEDGFTPKGIIGSTELPQAMFPQYIGHKFSEEATPLYQSTNQILVRETAITDGGRAAYLPIDHPSLSQYDLSPLERVDDGTQAYLQDLFYVTRGCIPMLASEGLRSGGYVTHGLVRFKGDLGLELRGTAFDTTFEGEAAETDLNGNLITQEVLDSYAAVVDEAILGHIASVDEPESLRLSSELPGVSGLLMPEVIIQTHYNGPDGIRPRPRMLVSYNDSAGITLVEWDEVNGPRVLTEPTAMWLAGNPGIPRYALMASIDNYVLYAARNNSTAYVVNLETGIFTGFPLQFGATSMVVDVVAWSLAGGLDGFLIAVSNADGTEGSLEWVDARRPGLGTELITSFIPGESPTALYCCDNQHALLATALGNDSVKVYELNQGGSLNELLALGLFNGTAERHIITSIFNHKGAAYGVIRNPGTSETFTPSVINLLTCEVLVGQSSFTNGPGLPYYAISTVVKAPDGIYIHYSGNGVGSQAVPTDLDLDPCQPIKQEEQVGTRILGLYRMQELTSCQTIITGVNQAAYQPSGRPMGVGEAYGHLVFANTGATQATALSIIKPTLRFHKAYAPLRAIRINTERPYPVLQRVNDAAVAIDTTTALWPGGATGTFDSPVLGNTSTQGVVDFISRDNKVYGVELLGHAASPAIRARIVPYTNNTGNDPHGSTRGPVLTMPFVPLDATAIADPVDNRTLLAWDITTLNIQPETLQATLDHEFANFLPPTIDFTRRLVAWDVGINLRTVDSDFNAGSTPVLFSHEIFSPVLSMDAIEISSELTAANTQAIGHRYFASSPGDFAVNAIGSTLGLTSYNGVVLGSSDVLYLGCQQQPSFTVG